MQVKCKSRNWDTEIFEGAISKALDIDAKITSMIESDVKVRYFDIDNAITTLKEFAEKGQCTMPEYHFSGPDSIGYDNIGNPKWCCTCRITNNKTGLTKQVEAASKKEAKKAAAYLILCEHLGVQNQYGPNDWFAFWTYRDGKLFPKRQFNDKEDNL